MKTNLILCEYCARLNPKDGGRCVACGAPLPVNVTPPVRVTVVEPSPAATVQPQMVASEPLSQQLKEGMAVVGSSLGVIGIGGLLLRTAAKAAAIAGAGLIIGMTSGNSASTFQSPVLLSLLAVAGGGIAGACVGLVSKRIFWTLVSAPAGALLGSLLSTILQLSNRDIPWTALLAIAGAVIFALLGGRRPAANKLRCLQYLRPVLGLAGGLLFTLVGFLITR